MVRPIRLVRFRLVFSPYGCCSFSVCILLRSVFSYRIYHLLQLTSSAGHLCIGVQFGALQNLQVRFPNFSIRWIGSSFIICFSFVDIKASGIVFFLFFFSYVFCLISSIIIFNSSVFAFIILSRNFLSVIAVIYFDINNSSAEIVLKLHSFSISISRLQKSFRCFLFCLFRPEEISAIMVCVSFWHVKFGE